MVEEDTSASADNPEIATDRDPKPSLRRSRSDKVIAGVCGGIGHRFGVDPVIIRLAWVALTLFGGSGILLYLIAWIVIGKEGDGESAVVSTLRGTGRRTGQGVLSIIIILLLLLLMGSPIGWLGSPFGWFTGWGTGSGLYIPLLLVGAGAALLLWPEVDPDESPSSSPSPSPSPHRRPPTQSRQARSQMSPAQPGPPTRPAFIESDFPSEPIESPTQARPRPFLGPLTLALLLILTGSAVAAHQADLINVEPSVFLAICLAVTGVMLTVSAFIGRARGLILLGIVLMPMAWGMHTVNITWWDGIGERSHVVESINELEDEYRLGVGRLTVDLRDLHLNGTTQEIAAGVSVGEVVVVVPRGMNVNLTADGRIGEVRVDQPGVDLVDEGFDATIQTVLGDQTGGTMIVDLDVGIGSARVEVR